MLLEQIARALALAPRLVDVARTPEKERVMTAVDAAHRRIVVLVEQGARAREVRRGGLVIPEDPALVGELGEEERQARVIAGGGAELDGAREVRDGLDRAAATRLGDPERARGARLERGRQGRAGAA